jgi:hypothetical protein
MAAVWVTSPHGTWALAARSGSELFCVEKTSRGLITWRHFRLNALASATRISRDPDAASRLRVNHGPMVDPIPEAVAVFVRLGLAIASPPMGCF